MATLIQNVNRVVNALKDIRAAIVAKGQTPTGKCETYADAIAKIQTGTDTSDATAAAGDIVKNQTAYVKGSKVTGTMAENALSTPSWNGATLTYGVGAGYSKSAKSSTTSISTVAAKTITPTTSSQTAVASGTRAYFSGAVTVGAIPSNYVDTSKGNATADTILKGYSAYVNGSCVSGNIPTFTNSSFTVTGISPTSGVTSAITCHVTTASYVTGGDYTGVSTYNITGQAGKTITPTKSTQTIISSGARAYFNGDWKVAAIPSNYITTSDATATAADIMSGKTAYVNGSKITGTASAGGGLCKYGEFNARVKATSTTETITLGFKPKYLYIWGGGANGAANNWTYTEADTSNYYSWANQADGSSNTTYTKRALNSTTNNRLKSITDTGFIWNNDTTAYSHKYMAIG